MIPQKVFTLIDAVVGTTTTTAALPIEGVRKASLFFIRTDGAEGDGGHTDLTVQMSRDGTNWVTSNMLISNAANAINQDVTRVAGLALGTNEILTAAVDLENGTPKYIRFVSTDDSDDGEITVQVVLEYY